MNQIHRTAEPSFSADCAFSYTEAGKSYRRFPILCESFYENLTFHIHIEHKDNGISLTAIGTYQLDGDTYQLDFKQIFVRNIHNEVISLLGDSEDVIAMRQNITCVRKGNQIVFTDHKSQTYYFA